MIGSALQSIHPLRLMGEILQMGPSASISLLLMGIFIMWYATHSQRMSGWLCVVGLLAHTLLLFLLGAKPQSHWLIFAWLGSFLLFWIPLTPLYEKLSSFLVPLLSTLAGLWFVVDVSRLAAHTLFGQANGIGFDAFLIVSVLTLGLTQWFRHISFQRLSWHYVATNFVVAAIGGLKLGHVSGASSLVDTPLLYITILTAGMGLVHLSRKFFEPTSDILDRYRLHQGVAATHLFLILFTVATLYPVLWVVKMAATPQKGFSMGLNPLPPSLLNYIQASRQGDKKAASCYSLAMVQNFRELLGVGEACYDQVCQVYRIHQKKVFLQQQKKICSSFTTAWKTEKDKRTAALQAWQNKLIRPMVPGPTKVLMGKLLKEVQYQQAKREKDGVLFWRYLWNSILVAFVTTFLGLVLACTAAYAFSRFRFPGRQAGLMSFLVSQMFPGTLMMIPLYILMSRLGLLDSLMGLSLVYSTTAIPFCVWMLKGYFDTIPKEIEEAALIDGASQTLIFWKIMMPLARPAIAVTALFSFMTAWNEFILAATFMNDESSYTLPVMLYKFVGRHDTDWGHFAAGAIIVSLPIIFLFFALQKNLVGGLTAGSVKG